MKKTEKTEESQEVLPLVQVFASAARLALRAAIAADAALLSKTPNDRAVASALHVAATAAAVLVSATARAAAAGDAVAMAGFVSDAEKLEETANLATMSFG